MVIWVITSSVISALLAGGGSYLISRKLSRADSKVLLEQAKAKAKVIEYEAEKFLQESKIKAKDIEIEAKEKCDKESARILKEYELNLLNFEKEKLRESQLIEKELCKLDNEKQNLSRDRNAFFEEQNALKNSKIPISKS